MISTLALTGSAVASWAGCFPSWSGGSTGSYSTDSYSPYYDSAGYPQADYYAANQQHQTQDAQQSAKPTKKAPPKTRMKNLY